MHRFFIIFVLSFSILLLEGCSSLSTKHEGILGKSQKQETVIKEQIQTANKELAKSNVDRLTKIGEFNYGVKYALDKLPMTNEVKIAYDLSIRIESLAEKPSLDAMKEMKKIVDDLLTDYEKGKKELEKKDKEISQLFSDINSIKKEKSDAIDRYVALADKTAAERDQYKATLGDMNSFFGLGAVFYGLKHFIFSMAWILGIGSILFLILRMLASSNPIAGAIFGVFEQVISWFVHCLKTVAPKAINIAGFVDGKIFDGYKKTLTDIIDSIQMLKEKEAVGTKYSIDDILTEISKSMNQDDKDRVSEIKKSLNWK